MPPYETFDPDQAEKNIQEGGTWLQLADGDEARIAIIGKDYRREQVWTAGHGETYDPENPKHIQFLNSLDKEGKPNRLQVRHSVNVVLRQEGDIAPKFSVRILELAPTHFKGIVRRVKRFGPNKWYDIQRTGSGAQDTRYDLDPAGDLSDEDKVAFDGLEFFDLEAFYKRKKNGGNGDDSFNYGANAE